MTKNSQIPTPAHIQADSMLARCFGKETVNYFSSSPLNRLSFLRSEHPFLSAAIRHPATRFVILKDLAPLTSSPSGLYYAKYDEVRKLVPETIYDKSEEDLLKEHDSRNTEPHLVFLGMDESRKQDGLAWKIYSGAPYFALDVSQRGSDEQQAIAADIVSSLQAQGLSFLEARVTMTFPADDAAIYAQARALVDWNTRNTGNPAERPACSTRTTLSNLSFPRTDPTIIVAVISSDAKRILLGRSKRFPPNWYSTLAGFIEPAESVEDAVRREVWEEAGVTLSRVVIHSTQPWPYPANLMIGAIAQVSDPAHEEISLKHDPELEDARWFEVAEVEEALRIGTSGLGESAGPQYKEGGLRLPPPTAIAHQLIQAAINIDFLDGDKNSKI
ncbi:hypothetical protein ARAM_000841 [Aspergillus rambellii]|uniref:NAD(+) diphosphatase n=1 Tax=Aspergillus rambellii TaxID=308745 RepID=A0A0F8US69_9EURO|nr:hypothetical protein ARAM_000841 [Aspergillus rambellii]